MFNLSFTVRDVIRAVWAGLFAFLASWWTLASGTGPFANFNEAKAALWATLPGAIAAGLSAIKNALLADGSLAKG